MTAEDYIEDIFNTLYILKIILMKRHRPLLDTRVRKCLKSHVRNPENTLQTQFHSIKGHQPSDHIKFQWDPWTAGRSVRSLTDDFCEAGLSILQTIKQSLALKSEQTEKRHKVMSQTVTQFARWQSATMSNILLVCAEIFSTANQHLWQVICFKLKLD